MKTIRLLAVFALLAALPLVTQAQLFKCQLPNGSYAYQDAPCDDNTKQQVLRVDKRGAIQAAPGGPANTSRAEPAPNVPLNSARVPGGSLPSNTATAAPTPAPESANKSNDARPARTSEIALLLLLLLLMIFSYFWLLIRIWRISIIGAILYFFFWPISIYFLIANWSEDDNIKTPFLVNVLSWLIFFGIAAMLGGPAYNDYLNKQKEAQMRSINAPPAR